MLYPILAIVIGLVLLVWSADRFVIGAAACARNFGMSPLLIGLTIVAFGTSAPEILVSTMASLADAGNLAVGNALGSNIANIALVLGVTALIAPLPVKSGVLRREIPLLIAVTVFAGFILLDLKLTRIDGVLLLCTLATCLFLFNRFQKMNGNDELSGADEEELPELTTGPALLWLLLGLTVLIVSSRMLVWGATEVALALGISELIIGLTIVAIGTSLPELAASITSALKGHHDIAIGNVVGSNIFNLAAVMAVPGLIAPLEMEQLVMLRDYSAMLIATLLLAAFALWQRPRTISRLEGGLLGAAYAGYMGLLYTMSV
ncbi:calcium/sodium antiporter [Marinobacterium arenosum]|uniref:calcium/sodium antiporter n=1 Tax=Marinobacterium arenosum TaxID=2862496 RepID=UPI001C94F975|nr:calcium/sodium antiporter [Marinobacterium arenosum]MBY4676766.1 calcium/sodium antiporter [Marinobacterium arenosum]